MLRHWRVILQVLAGLAALYVGAKVLPPLWSAYQMRGETIAEKLEVNGLAGEKISLNESGQAKVLVFWATWCGPCKLLLDEFVKKANEGRLPPERVVIVSAGESRDIVEKTVRERGYPFVVGLDETGGAFRKFNVQATPTTYFVDDASEVKWSAVGVYPGMASRAAEFLNK